MNRQHPILSPLGLASAVILIIGIIIGVFLTGGAQFSPGPLTALAASGQTLGGHKTHAEFENDCTHCHAPWRGIAVDRCQQCHANVADEIATHTGLHSQMPADAATQCAHCHPDHHGVQFSPASAALKFFDHTTAGFSLDQHLLDFSGAALSCKTCHTRAVYGLEPDACVACHQAAKPDFMAAHRAAFGDECVRCHTGAVEPKFAHKSTGFDLVGKHTQTACGDCHKAGAQTLTQCVACHRPPDSHGATLGIECGNCHDPAGWTPAHVGDQQSFTHAQTKFQLTSHKVDYAGAPLTCAGCHQPPDFSAKLPQCVACHQKHDAAFVTKHQTDYGLNCVDCHDGANNMKNFKHDQVLPLDGKHAGLTCDKCHTDMRFQRDVLRACVDCHAEPDVHKGLFGLHCADCHITAAWTPAQLIRHTFPLNHGQKDPAVSVPCLTCHPKNYVTYTCYGCHDHVEAQTIQQHAKVDLKGQPLENCAVCHIDGRTKEGN